MFFSELEWRGMFLLWIDYKCEKLQNLHKKKLQLDQRLQCGERELQCGLKNFERKQNDNS